MAVSRFRCALNRARSRDPEKSTGHQQGTTALAELLSGCEEFVLFHILGVFPAYAHVLQVCNRHSFAVCENNVQRVPSVSKFSNNDADLVPQNAGVDECLHVSVHVSLRLSVRVPSVSLCFSVYVLTLKCVCPYDLVCMSLCFSVYVLTLKYVCPYPVVHVFSRTG